MNLAAIFLLILVFVLILLFVTRPFFVRQRIHPMRANQKLSSLQAEREQLLTAIQELDSDQALEKITAEDYASQRSAFLKKGGDVLRQIDALTSDSANERTAQKEVKPVRSNPTAVMLSDEDLEELLTRRRSIRKEKTGGFCPKCGKPVLFSDAFCPSCGHALK